MSRSILAVAILMSGFLLSGCQTSMLKVYNKISLGMEKDDVLELMGSPQRTQRFHGKDRWTYVFYDTKVRYEKEVQFFEGNAIYVGDKWEPEVTAAQVDAKNEASNKALEDESLRKYQENPQAYSNYEKEVRGTDKVRYVPSFKPVQ